MENYTINLAAEVGFTCGLGRPTIGLVRKGTFIDWMLQGMLSKVIEVDNLDNIESYIDELVKELKRHVK